MKILFLFFSALINFQFITFHHFSAVLECKLNHFVLFVCFHSLLIVKLDRQAEKISNSI